MIHPTNCTLCPNLSSSRKNIIWGEGPTSTSIMLIGEAPGTLEDKFGRPFVEKAPAGGELTTLLQRNRIERSGIYVTNCLLCHPPDDRDPTSEELANCDSWLRADLTLIKPKFIITVGRYATRKFLGDDAEMEMVHGIPYQVPVQTTDGFIISTVIPVYHPAAGLHSSSTMIMVHDDFKAAGEIIRGQRPSTHIHDSYPDVDYRVEDNPDSVAMDMRIAQEKGFLGLDTENVDGNVWSIQYSHTPGTGRFIWATDESCVRELAKGVSHPDLLTGIANSLYDLPLLRQLHPVPVIPTTPVDTLVMAYLLQRYPKGLKPLAYRFCGMKMTDYTEMTRDATHRKAMAYLANAVEREWPDPPKVLEIRPDGKPHIKQPQNIGRKIARILHDVSRDMWEGGLEPANPRERWMNIELESGREFVESTLGPMPEGNLSDIPFPDALFYACRDADAVVRVFPRLWEEISSCDLLDTFWRDMKTIPMVSDMMIAGIKGNREKFIALSRYFELQIHSVLNELTSHIRACGWQWDHINPGSWQQVARLLYDKSFFSLRKYVRGMKGEGSTDNKALSMLLEMRGRIGDKAARAIELIQDYRGYVKLKGTYSDPMPGHMDGDSRIHTTFRITNTTTGRLSSSTPNLMAFPVRSDDGRRLREGFEAADGCVLVSADYCLDGDTEVITADGYMKMRDIVGKPAIKVLSIRGKGILEFRDVTAASLIGNLPTVCINLSDGSSVICTVDHEWMDYFYIMRKTSGLNVGSRLLHVKSDYASNSRYPTWYVRSNRNYRYKHRLVAEALYGKPVKGMEVDHIDGDVKNWKGENLRYFPKHINRAQGGERYWSAVKNGKRDDDTRLGALKYALNNKRRPYNGSGNPNFGKLKGSMSVCPVCGEEFYASPSRKQKYCGWECHTHRNNHSVVSIEWAGVRPVYQITVEGNHNYVLKNGLVSGNSQIELRVLAHCSEDPVMMEIFQSGIDLHTKTASEVFGVAMDQVDEMQQRRPAKTISFGIVYGMGGEGLQSNLATMGLNWDLVRCEKLIEEWFKLYRGVRRFMDGVHDHAKRYGWVKDMFGRRRYVPNAQSKNNRLRAEALREGGNHPIQAGAQGVIKQAMGDLVTVYGKFRESGVVWNPLLQIHDDIVSEIGERSVGIVLPVLKHIMENAVLLNVPVKVDAKMGKSWGSMEKWKGEGS